jgi:hypothetical protein
MQIIIAVIGVFGAAGTIAVLSTVDMAGGVKAAIIAVVVFIAVYSMARIQPKASQSEKDTEKECVAASCERSSAAKDIRFPLKA